ncbi:MAG: hypothetical protein OK474_09240 [Thaumarchaeota archaeon]|nr:hypothetical protein [Nitrososphaerota archaeon]
MAKMGVCACGWTVISPLGQEDIKKHVMIHLKDNHPGTILTDEDIRRLTRDL